MEKKFTLKGTSESEDVLDQDLYAHVLPFRGGYLVVLNNIPDTEEASIGDLPTNDNPPDFATFDKAVQYARMKLKERGYTVEEQ